ncbi:predicted protein [Nematostella vectensis]|uniref:Eukaryotic translation initiation factor 2A n=1 Tax=Nematostella vectensis TaxID=45351 RepID=A7S8G4_NEMVE|nr:predicted protein [Nematostella vectensis]|eukprot:XP_001632001.1 predicted protein [Nematostella vectensis]
MAAKAPLIALRGNQGISMVEGTPPCAPNPNFVSDPSSTCRVMAFSLDGSLFSWCNGECVNIINTLTGVLVHQLPKTKTACLSFSPRGNYLSTWEPFTTSKDNPNGSKNLEIWDIKSGQAIVAFYQKKRDTWQPRWTDDEEVCARSVSNEVHCFHGGDFSNIASKLRLQGVGSFEISHGKAPYTIAAYVPGTKGAPSAVRLFQHPDFDNPGSVLANKSFFKADKVDIKWNKKGTSALVLTSVEVDASGASYYGEQTLHCVNTSGESSMVQLGKKGPIYDVAWSPTLQEFCVVYGYMPAKATLYNHRCDAVFDFGTGPRNEIHYNPHGNILCLTGFGNLRGWMEFWSRKDLKMISKPQASDTTYFEWSPDGEHILTATTAPRLREGNGFKIWHYTGALKYQTDVKELWQATWQPCPEGVFKEKPVTLKAQATQESKPSGAYVPPHLRGAGAKKPAIKIHEDELPQNLKKAQENESKAAAKNRKKREAKARSKQEEENQPTSQVVENAPLSPSAPAAAVSGDNEKKIRNLKKKLRQIEELKTQQKAGKQLEVNQLEKLKNEDALLKEIKALEIGS